MNPSAADLKSKGFVEMPDGSFEKPTRKQFVQVTPELRNQNAEPNGTGKPRVCVAGPEQALAGVDAANREVRKASTPVHIHVGASTDEQKLNKTEKARLEYLRRLPHVKCLHIQAVTVKIGHDCRFTPDFFYYDEVREQLVAEDTKGGHVWEDSRIKAKAAARMFPEFLFIVAYKEKSGWREEEFKP